MQCFRLVKAGSDLDIIEHMMTRNAYLTARLSVVGLGLKPKFGALVIFYRIGILVIILALVYF